MILEVSFPSKKEKQKCVLFV